MPLISECAEGDTVTIARLLGTGAIKGRLLEMGFTRGETATIVKYAPLNDPIEIRLKGFHVSLRVSEAQRIEVAPA